MTQTGITDKQAAFFHDNGYLIVRGVLDGAELTRVQAAMQELYDYGSTAKRDEADYYYGKGHQSGEARLARIEYVIDKKDDMKVLLGNPFILRSTEKLMGSDLFPTWDAMVLKAPGEGIVVPWHRDAATDLASDKPIFNVDFYLDAATEANCVWVIPGSHRWDKTRADAWIAAHREDTTAAAFQATGAVPALMEPGDVMFHDILVLHGSPATNAAALRRVVYYEFRTAHVEAAVGPHVPAYIPLKQKVLLACIARRKQADYILKDEEPFVYNPPAPYNTVTLAPDEEPPTYRYLHGDYWRK